MRHRIIAPPSYSAGKFVDREAEIKLVVEKANALAAGSPVDQRVVVFTNGRGTGKTWLLAHLQTILHTLPHVIPFLLSLGEYAGGRDPHLAVVDILQQFGAEVMGQRQGSRTPPAEMSRSLKQDLQPLLEKQVLALLVDQVHESDWQLLAALEDYLLGPLAVEPRALIVMAGRGRPYPWRTPELRLKAQFVNLEPFPDVAATETQLKRQVKWAAKRAAEIHDLSAGNPLANYLLAFHKDPAAALNQVVEGMLEPVPNPDRGRARDYLQALCVLHSFDEERIPTMLAAYHDDPAYNHWTFAQAKQVREELVRWAFAKWDESQGGYILDTSVRPLVERYLKTARREQWKQLHDAARQLYERWIAKYPRAQDRWQPEADYHRSISGGA